MRYLPKLEELHVLVQLPDDWRTHVTNLENAYKTALEEIVFLQAELEVSRDFNERLKDAMAKGYRLVRNT